MDDTQHLDEKRTEANRLYWEDDRSVEALALALEMSRAALYACVVPLSADAECSACGGETAYPNRSHRATGRTRCLSCEAEGVDGRRVMDGEGNPLDHAEAEQAGDEPRVERWRRDLAAVDGQRKWLIGGGAAVGVLVGMAAVAAVRELK